MWVAAVEAAQQLAWCSAVPVEATGGGNRWRQSREVKWADGAGPATRTDEPKRVGKSRGGERRWRGPMRHTARRFAAAAAAGENLLALRHQQDQHVATPPHQRRAAVRSMPAAHGEARRADAASRRAVPAVWQRQPRDWPGVHLAAAPCYWRPVAVRILLLQSAAAGGGAALPSVQRRPPRPCQGPLAPSTNNRPRVAVPEVAVPHLPQPGDQKGKAGAAAGGG
mgnify:CR=1 FL=1